MKTRVVLTGVVTVVMLSVVNTSGAYFQDDFNRSDGEVGNGWATQTYGTIEVKIVDNEVLIAGRQPSDWWWKSGILRSVEGATRFSFDFKADDNFTVHIQIRDPEVVDGYIEFYASPGGPFSYCYDVSDVWSDWIEIPGSQMIAGEYNNLVLEQCGAEFRFTLNDQTVGTFMNNLPFHAKEVLISADAPLGTSGSLHIDNVVIRKLPIITNFDFNSDGTVDVKDVVTLTDHWGQDYSVCDISPMPWGDGMVDAKDLLALANYLEQEMALIAHWTLDETEGLTAYDSAGVNDGTVIGVPAWQPDGGTVGGALEFDGATFVVADSVLDPSDGPFSVLAWVKGGAPGQALISQVSGVNWLMADPLSGTLITELRAPTRDNQRLVSETVITDGDWHRVGFVWDGVSRMLYVDDVLVASDTQSSLAGCAGSLIFGRSSATPPGPSWTGLIDDIRIYNRAVKP